MAHPLDLYLFEYHSLAEVAAILIDQRDHPPPATLEVAAAIAGQAFPDLPAGPLRDAFAQALFDHVAT